MADPDVIVVGAGMTGMSCARALVDAGLTVLVLDKGRGVGGRLATRRAEGGLQFDHGAQYVTAKTDEFRSVLQQATQRGDAANWDLGDRQPFVGVPGMSALAKTLGQGIVVRQKTEIRSVCQSNGAYDLSLADGTATAPIVVLTVPAPQAIALLGADHALSEQIAHVRILPCLTLMAAFEGDETGPFTHRRDRADPISWIAQNSSKPGRPTRACWVAQAGPEFSVEHLERDKPDIAAIMLPMLCDRIGADPGTAVYAAGHRWRYAAVDVPLGKDFARSVDGGLYLGGDWCIGARVEAAWTSGTAIARDIVARR